MDYLLFVKPMRTFDGVVFARTRMGFSRYLRHHRTHYRIQERVYNYHCRLLEFKIEEQMEIEKIIELDKKFMALTTPEEREMIKYLAIIIQMKGLLNIFMNLLNLHIQSGIQFFITIVIRYSEK